MGCWFNLSEVLIRRKRGNNTRSSLNIGLVLLATPMILSHVGAKLALLARHSRKIVVAKTGIFSNPAREETHGLAGLEIEIETRSLI